ncbi:MAG: alanine racemase [Treponema sp.]|jgi:alanine racemase|nr:alanine racemase [Treponema sp.]
MRASRVLVHLDLFRENIRALRKRVGEGPKICVPVKADAYGHGALPIARSALEAGAEYLAVAYVQEGAELRAAGIEAPVLLLSQPLEEEYQELISLDLIPLVSDPLFAGDLARAARAAGKKLTVHLKIDSGMGRAGCRPAEAAGLAACIASAGQLRLGGIATHLAVSDSPEPEDLAYTRVQLARFREAVDSIKASGIDPGIVHAANSGALVFHGDSWFHMVRPGILLYGYSPAGSGGPVPVKPVMELRSAVTLIKSLRRGETVSYGRTWAAPEDTLIGTIPLGYADGLRRALSGKWRVSIGGRSYPLVGRICMDQCMVNLGSGEDRIRSGDEVIVFGGQAEGTGDAARMAEALGTIPYEITCGIGKRVPRVYTGLAR